MCCAPVNVIADRVSDLMAIGGLGALKRRRRRCQLMLRLVLSRGSSTEGKSSDLLSEHAEMSPLPFSLSQKREKYAASACRTTPVKVKPTRALCRSAPSEAALAPARGLLISDRCSKVCVSLQQMHQSAGKSPRSGVKQEPAAKGPLQPVAMVILPYALICHIPKLWSGFCFFSPQGAVVAHFCMESVKYWELGAKMSQICEQIIDNCQS